MNDSPRSGIAFLGAMNLDTVVVGPPGEEVFAHFTESNYSPYTEQILSDGAADELAQSLADRAMDQLGGSAFNVIRCLLPFGRILPLSFVGCAGRAGAKWPHIDFLENSSVDTSLCRRSEMPPARSISFAHDGDRSLFTSVGASAEIADHISDHYDEIVRFLTRHNAVHVTSILDEASTGAIGRVLASAVNVRKDLVVSVDPGAYWASNSHAAAKYVISQATMLHVNVQEFEGLGSRVGREPDRFVAARVLSQMRAGAVCTLFVRRHSSVSVYIGLPGSDPSEIAVDNDDVVRVSSVVDATGAGDTFTAGVLLALASSETRAVVATRLGVAFARSKIAHVGPATHADILNSYRSVLGEVVLDGRRITDEGN